MNVTPLMKQYRLIKAKHPDTVLLFRVGDFYETFEEDAICASKTLGITLTKRGNGAAGEVPLAGFPYHALDAYLPKLLRAGLKVAVCEQLEDPKLAKGLVKRDVIEVVTPGIAFSDNVLEKKQNNYLAALALPSAIAGAGDTAGVAFVDASTAEFQTVEASLKTAVEILSALQPSELLVQKRDLESLRTLLEGNLKAIITKVDDWVFNREYAYELLVNHFNTQTLKGYGIEDYSVGVVAAGAVLQYLQETQRGNLGHLRRIVPFDVGSVMILDPATKRNLEITSSMSGGSTDGTLVSVLDKTVTPMGARMLKRWVNQPLRSKDAIDERLDAVDSLVDKQRMRNAISEELSSVGDLERLVARIATNRANPREVLQVAASLRSIPSIRALLETEDVKILASVRQQLDPLESLVAMIAETLTDDPPLSLADGGVIRSGCSPELDELRSIASGGREWIARLQQTERTKTGISSLKVGYNNVFGYYIEVTNTHKEKVPAEYIRKQTLTNAERYVTPALKEFEEKILNAEEKMRALETEVFNGLRTSVSEHASAIQQNARLIAALDTLCSLASAAVEYKFVRPEIDETESIVISEGRHPVLERLLPPGERYTPNDTDLDTLTAQIHIITGPNMSGKSSYLRQTGLIVLLAQVGSFVPAAAARIGIVDKIFTRVGASDNIVAGESTFLVEMHEAAHIVNTATRKSLILLDEVGRGTSTFDGISIAWALTEYVHEHIGARTLFATHYHELNRLADTFSRVKNYKVDVREYGDKVIFLHKVVAGFADHSYGIQVAQMAGLPPEVTERAKIILTNLEASELNTSAEKGAGTRERLPKPGKFVEPPRDDAPQLALFEIRPSEIEKILRDIDIQTITPLEALNLVAALKKKME